ncbi:MAG: hypothetical protein ACRD5D_05825 [Candidatus Polarisedimenticolia bacterium]
MPGRLELLAAVLILAGMLFAGRSGTRLLEAIRARFTLGAPYRRGTIADRSIALLMSLPVPAAGLLLGFLSLAQASFQGVTPTVRAGQIEARRTGWGRAHVRFVPDPFYPARRLLEAEISGARWGVVGEFVSWDPGVRWLGLRDGHRVRWLYGTNDTTGLTPAARSDRALLDTLPWAAGRLVAAARFVPFLTIRHQASPWFPLADRQVMVLYATGAGYLADVASEGGRE